ncbi:hypothetical protein BURPS1710b_A1736 [Burkholderia pseudomallei 1710b]|uniref:Uncharacterized protein n=1 Tax=Burkholderia pseudomallei (strain 1710b) TaxID=320372 RepID=Q3JHR1_BURP1|nr:hypothetical protein BURPS1710b_A1736 [Burkholderia pseudomallei 1710b]
MNRIIAHRFQLWNFNFNIEIIGLVRRMRKARRISGLAAVGTLGPDLAIYRHLSGGVDGQPTTDQRRREIPRGGRGRAAAAGGRRDHRVRREDGRGGRLQGGLSVGRRRRRELARHPRSRHQHDGRRARRREPDHERDEPAAARRHRYRLGRRVQHRAHDPLVHQGGRGRRAPRGPGRPEALRPPPGQGMRAGGRDGRPDQGGRRRAHRRNLRDHGAHRRRGGRGHRRGDRARDRVRRGGRGHDLPRGDEDARRLPPLQGGGEGADSREPDRVRLDAAVHARRAEGRERRHRALLLRRVPRDEQGRAELLRNGAPRRHAKGRGADDANARATVRLSRLLRVRREAGPAFQPRPQLKRRSTDSRIRTPGEYKDERDEGSSGNGRCGRFQAEEVGCAVGRRGGQYRALHGRQDRQRSALPRLRHSRYRRLERIRGNRAPARARDAAERDRAGRVQGEAARDARAAREREGGARMDSGVRAPDGRDAHRRIGARHRAAREGRPQPAGRARHRGPADGLARLDAAVLVSLFAQRPAHRNRNRRRFDRRAFPAPAARQDAVEIVDRRDAHVADPVRGARVQCLDVHRARDRRHGLGHVFVDHGRDRRAARAEARRRERGRLRDPEPLPHARRSAGRHPPPRREQGSRDRLRPPGVHDLRSAQQGDQGSRAQAVEGSGRPEALQHRRATRIGDVGDQEDVPEPRLVQRGVVSHDGRADRDVHAAVRDRAHRRLERAHHRAAGRQQDHPPERELHRAGRPEVRADREALIGGTRRPGVAPGRFATIVTQSVPTQ